MYIVHRQHRTRRAVPRLYYEPNPRALMLKQDISGEATVTQRRTRIWHDITHGKFQEECNMGQ